MKKIKSILLIEDDEITNFLNQTVIEETGVAEEIIVALNGLEGLSYLQRLQSPDDFPSLILLDINMPVLDGFSFLEEYYRLPLVEDTSTKIVVLSTSSNSSDMNQMRSLGITTCLQKPLNEKDFRKVVAEL
ncbi:response regulator [Rufibacter sediminis]|uniref:Response regulator n=1 Tax=Rufibacter sediminis TaxID=2762756 RepID=A0ABR6VP91_9BACT|nr:response regulator [Rufibacter sediminis]MBC3538704.1 response regulator [Rufibacter sediminis]